MIEIVKSSYLENYKLKDKNIKYTIKIDEEFPKMLDTNNEHLALTHHNML